MASKAEKSLRVSGWVSSYPPVNNLLLHLLRKSKSEGTKSVYLAHLHKFCRFMKKTPTQLIRVKRNEAEKAIQGYADSFGDVSRSYANIAICALKCFYSVNGFRRNRALDIELYYQPPRHRLTQEYIPTKSEVYRMADSCRSLRDRAIMLMLFSSGLRNSTLRALLVRDLAKELLAGVGNPIVQIYPDMKRVDPNACKGGIPYYTFLCDEGAQAVRLYLEDRKLRFGALGEDEPLFCTEYNQLEQLERRKKPISSRELQIIIKDTARRAGITKWDLVHPHVLRKSYETILRGQLIDGSNLDVKTQEFFMGHVLAGSQDNYYDYSKVESMRTLYSNLKFGRSIVENKFKLLRAAVGRAFEGTDVDPEEIIAQYAAMKKVDAGK